MELHEVTISYDSISLFFPVFVRVKLKVFHNSFITSWDDADEHLMDIPSCASSDVSVTGYHWNLSLWMHSILPVTTYCLAKS